MIAANKSTVYPEYLPDWAYKTRPSVSDMLLAQVSEDIYVDTRPSLIAARVRLPYPLFYKTDTHWNKLGAWVAFQIFTNKLDDIEKGLFWLSSNQVHVSQVNERNGGDLARFLWLQNELHDSEIILTIDMPQPIETEQFDFNSGQLMASGGNHPIDNDSITKPLWIKSKNALNQKRVLWLRDSFGTALSPLMAATFSDTLQLHYNKADTLMFEKLVNSFKPDYVFITVVERQSLLDWFKNPPPIF